MSLRRWITGITALLIGAGFAQALVVARDLQVTTASLPWRVLLSAWGLAFGAAAAAFLLADRPSAARVAAGLARRARGSTLLRRAALPAFSLLALSVPALVLSRLPHPLDLLMATLAWRLVAFWTAALAGAGLLALRGSGGLFGYDFAAAALAYAVVLRAAAFLPDLSSYPFSLGWSEASRYYYASLFLAEKVYGEAALPTVLHPTRYLLQAVPFLAASLPLWAHRLWQVALWLGANGLAAWLVARRFRPLAEADAAPRTYPWTWLAAAWSFLFLFQAPIWYHLVVMVAAVLWGARPEQPWRTAGVVALVSVWAGMSRINWIPFPAALAALVYLLDVPRAGSPAARYLAPPVGWSLLGAACGFAAQWAYAVLSGNALDQFASSFTSDLLWYRLFPSATYPLGVLPGVLLASAPALWALRERLRGRAPDPLRLLGAAALLVVFFAGGLVVSAKIGGGSNLHNLDAYIALLLVLAVWAFSGIRLRAHGLLIAIAIAVPLGFTLAAAAPLPQLDPTEGARELVELRRWVEAASASGEEVLFISERHLLALGQVQGVPLVEDYEKVFLMEMAMAGNPGYLDRFEQDLAAGRFGLIVADIVRFNPQTRENAFGEENNAWDHFVSFPLLCYYEEVQTLESARVEILAPKAVPECPQVPEGW